MVMILNFLCKILPFTIHLQYRYSVLKVLFCARSKGKGDIWPLNGIWNTLSYSNLCRCISQKRLQNFNALFREIWAL